MIRKEELIERSKRKQLNGALVEEYKLENDTYIFRIDSFRFNYEETNVDISNIDEPVSIYLDHDYMDEYYSLSMNKNGEDIGFARTNIEIYMRNNIHRAVSFKEFKLDIDETPKIGDNKHSCMVLDIELGAKIFFQEGKYDIYEDIISVAVDINGCFIYCINYTDGTLPTILVSKDKLSKEKIESIIFEQSTDTIFNSYYHPHQYKQVQEKIFNDTVFGSPGGNLKGLNFDEKLNGKNYENSDGVSGIYNEEDGNIIVKLGDQKIARYVKGGPDQNDISSITMYDNYKLWFLNKDVPDSTISSKDLASKYDKLSDKNIKIGEDIIYRVFDSFKDECGVYYDYISKDRISIIRISKDEKFIEVFNIFNKKHNEEMDVTYPENTTKQYIAMDLEKDLLYSIHTTINEDTNMDCFINSTKNRLINVSRDSNIIMFNNGIYYITCNKNNDVINTNMGIEGQIIPYNIFGIPTYF